MNWTNLALHVFCYYIVWFSCVLFAAQGDYTKGVLVALVVSLFQFLWQKRSKEVQNLGRLIFLFCLFGFTVDSIFSLQDLIRFKANPWPIAFAPPWIIALWLNFAIVFYACLQRLFQAYFVLGCLSFVGFPLAYAAGVFMGAADLPGGLYWLLLYGLVWSFLFPLLMYLYNRVSEAV